MIIHCMFDEHKLRKILYVIYSSVVYLENIEEYRPKKLEFGDEY